MLAFEDFSRLMLRAFVSSKFFSMPRRSRSRRPFPDDLRHLDRLRDQSEARKTVGDGLLAPDHLVVDGNRAIVRTAHEAPDGLKIDTRRLRLRRGDFLVMSAGPNAFRSEHGIEPGDLAG